MTLQALQAAASRGREGGCGAGATGAYRRLVLNALSRVRGVVPRRAGHVVIEQAEWFCKCNGDAKGMGTVIRDRECTHSFDAKDAQG